MITQIAFGIGVLLVLVGLWGMLTRRNLIKIVIGFSIIDTGVHLIMVTVGYRPGATAPILGEGVTTGTAAGVVADPTPQALVLTAIVIGLAVTALMLTVAVRLANANGSLSIEAQKELRW